MRKALAYVRASFLWLLLLPFALQFGGAASNEAVLIANYDTFPVMVNPVKLGDLLPDGVNVQPGQSQMIDDVHCTMTADTHLNALADIFDTRNAIYSIGDFMLIAGEQSETFCVLFWILLMLYKEKQRLA